MPLATMPSPVHSRFELDSRAEFYSNGETGLGEVLIATSRSEFVSTTIFIPTAEADINCTRARTCTISTNMHVHMRHVAIDVTVRIICVDVAAIANVNTSQSRIQHIHVTRRQH